MAYSEEDKKRIVDEICNKISNGKSLRRSLIESEIAFETFYRWIDSDESKSKQYVRATELRAEEMAEQILEIIDATENDIIIDPNTGSPVTNHNVIQRDRLRADKRQWLMSKMFPKKYGDRVQQDVNITQEQPLFGNE